MDETINYNRIEGFDGNSEDIDSYLLGLKFNQLKSIYLLLHIKYLKKVNLKIGAADKKIANYLKVCAKKHGQEGVFYIDDSINCLIDSDLAVVSSGTVALEAFLCSKPMVVCYKTSKLNFLCKSSESNAL